MDEISGNLAAISLIQGLGDQLLVHSTIGVSRGIFAKL